MSTYISTRHAGTKTRRKIFWFRAFVSSWLISVALVFAAGDGLDPAKLLKPLGEEWTSYSGDYSGRRYSTRAQVNQSNVKSLALAWVRKLSGPPSLTGGGGGRRGGGGLRGSGRYLEKYVRIGPKYLSFQPSRYLSA